MRHRREDIIYIIYIYIYIYIDIYIYIYIKYIILFNVNILYNKVNLY